MVSQFPVWASPINTPIIEATPTMIGVHGSLSRDSSITWGRPCPSRPTTLKVCDCLVALVNVLAAVRPFKSSSNEESPAAMTNTAKTVNHRVVKTARSPIELNHNRSTKKRLDTASSTKIAMIDATTMTMPFFIGGDLLQTQPWYNIKPGRKAFIEIARRDYL